MKWQSRIATIAILLVAGSAFVAGFYQNSIRAEASNLREQAVPLQENLSRMETRASIILSEDSMFRLESERYFIEARLVDDELRFLNDTLTPTERYTYLLKIDFLLGEYNQALGKLKIIVFYGHFHIDELPSYGISSEHIDGYDYFVNKSAWDWYVEVIGMPVVFLTPYEVFGEFTSFEHLNSFWNITIAHPRPGGEFSRCTEYILLSSIREVETQIEQLLTLVDQRNVLADQVALGITLTAVGSILSAAMANRINGRDDKQEMAEIKAAINKEEETQKQKIDFISVPVLIISGILAVYGVVFAFI